MRLRIVRALAFCLILAVGPELLGGEPLHVRVLPGGGGNNDFRVPGLTSLDGTGDNGVPIMRGGLPPIGDIAGFDVSLTDPGSGMPALSPPLPGGGGTPRIPEPSTGLLLLLGGSLLRFLRRASQRR